ncbi:MAG: response regulator [Prevotellaceae bacterium]|nr:response regulator [Prevotellaceae bacterium]
MKYGTILIVDDNPAILTALKICLVDVFERILTLAHPEGVLALLQQERVDVILLDMNFTVGMNSGQEGLTWLRSIHRLHADIPVVLVTAFADVQLAVKGLKAGASDFITKPWDNDDLIRTLKDAIDNNNHIDTLETVEAQHVRKVLDKCHGNISHAAELLGITRQTLYSKIKK